MIANPSTDYPVEFQDTWNVVDPSKIEVWNDCKRKFFFEHVLGWQSDGPNVHLVFGEGMHRALEHLLIQGVANRRGYSLEVINEAYAKFLTFWREHFDQEQDEIFRPKNPEHLYAGLIKYASEYEHRDARLDILYTEIAGSVPISHDDSIHFRIDAIVYDREQDAYYTLEHKSGSGINRFWTDKWDLHHQPFAYTHALYSVFDPAKVKGVKINGVHFMKTKTELIRIPCWKTKAQMDAWLWEIRDVFSDMQFEFERFANCSEEDATLMAFPKNPNACTKYFGCPFHDYCCAWQNPLARAYEPPTGFIIDFWDPRNLFHNETWELQNANFVGEDSNQHLIDPDRDMADRVD